VAVIESFDEQAIAALEIGEQRSRRHDAGRQWQIHRLRRVIDAQAEVR